MKTVHRFFTRAFLIVCIMQASSSMAMFPGGCIPKITVNPGKVFMEKSIDAAKTVAIIAFFAWLGLPNPIPKNPILDSSVLTTVCF